MSFISNAYAGTTVAQSGASTSSIETMIMFAGFGLIFYFLVWRPQNQQAKEQRALIAGLKKGDEVVTTGGLLGTITETTDHFVTLAIAPTLEIKVQKNSITATLPKGTLKSI